jgi:hypothetical protein
LIKSFRIAALAFFCIGGRLGAGVITFSDLASGSCNFLGSSANSAGFTFADQSGGGNGLFLCDGNVVSDTPLVSMLSANGVSSILMTEQDSGVFALNSFDAGARTDGDYGTLTGIEVLGTYANSSTVNLDLPVVGTDFQTFTLPGSFANIVSIQFTALGPGGSFGGPEFTINNIVFDESSVPEPRSIFAMGGCLLALAIWRRRRAKNQMVITAAAG